MPERTKSDHAALVTGASTGIGEACTIELVNRGWRVFAGVRDEAAAERLKTAADGRLVPVLLDVTEPDHIVATREKIAGEVGSSGLDGLINNAGVAMPGPFEALSIDDLRRQMEVNFFGQLAVTQAMLPMLRDAAGRIVMMSSLNGRVSPPYLGAYASSKFALEAASDALRVELRRWKIRVAVVEPSSVQTPIWAKSKSLGKRLSERVSPEMRELYQTDIEAMNLAADGLASGAMPVRKVVGAVIHALTARRPRTRYPVGIDARLATALLPVLPDRVGDWIIRRSLGLK